MSLLRFLLKNVQDVQGGKLLILPQMPTSSSNSVPPKTITSVQRGGIVQNNQITIPGRVVASNIVGTSAARPNQVQSGMIKPSKATSISNKCLPNYQNKLACAFLWMTKKYDQNQPRSYWVIPWHRSARLSEKINSVNETMKQDRAASCRWRFTFNCICSIPKLRS